MGEGGKGEDNPDDYKDDEMGEILILDLDSKVRGNECMCLHSTAKSLEELLSRTVTI